MQFLYEQEKLQLSKDRLRHRLRRHYHLGLVVHRRHRQQPPSIQLQLVFYLVD
jgi:hypothetical protein